VQPAAHSGRSATGAAVSTGHGGHETTHAARGSTGLEGGSELWFTTWVTPGSWPGAVTVTVIGDT
jgi:hypothetical protein